MEDYLKKRIENIKNLILLKKQQHFCKISIILNKDVKKKI